MALISKDFITAEELADAKGVSVKTVYTWIRQGIAPAYEPFGGRYWFYREPALAFTPPRRGPKGKAA